MKTMFSIIVPIYNVEEYLEKCIDSILAQTYENFELILVDDGSPDNCPQICDEYAKKDKRIKVIHKENGGLVSARNIGIKNAIGDYICYVDGDDWIVSNFLKDINEVILSNENIDIVIFNMRRIYSDYTQNIEFYVEEGLYNKERLEKEVYPYMMYDSRRPFCTGLIFPAACNKIYKRELLIEHHCENEKIKMGEDNAFVFECILYSNNVYFLDKILYEYNQLNPTSFANSYDKNRFDNNEILISYIENRIGNYSEIINEQVNAFKTYWLIMAIFHEVKSNRKLFVSRRHISNKIKNTKALKNISFKNLPKSAKCYLILLRCHLYLLALIGAKIMNSKRKKSCKRR